MANIQNLSKQLSESIRIADLFEQKYGPHALLREKQALLKAFEPPTYVTDMTRIQDALRVACNPFEEMLRSLRPSVDDLRFRFGLDQSALEAIRTTAESFSRLSDMEARLGSFRQLGLGHSMVDQLLRSQGQIAEMGNKLRQQISGIEWPNLLPHDRVAGALAGLTVLSEMNEVYRLTAGPALEAVRGYQSFADRQLGKALTDSTAVLSRRMTITDLAGDLLENAQTSWELLGRHATVSPTPVYIQPLSPNIYPRLNQQVTYLYRDSVDDDPVAAFDRSTAANISNSAAELVYLIHNINEYEASSGSKYVFKPTNRGLLATTEITTTVADCQVTFGRVIDALYTLLYEGSGDAKRLTTIMSDQDLETLWWIKTLRTSFRHDVDHGDEAKSSKRHIDFGEVYTQLIGNSLPIRAAQWAAAQVALYDRTAQLLRHVLDTIDARES